MLRTLEFLPAMPPSTVSGKVMSAQMTRMMHIVPKGSAAVDCTWRKARQQRPGDFAHNKWDSGSSIAIVYWMYQCCGFVAL